MFSLWLHAWDIFEMIILFDDKYNEDLNDNDESNLTKPLENNIVKRFLTTCPILS